jgi:glyoxalase family protein
MNNKIKGLHHVTAIASDAQKNFDFYAGILGMRMVKKTVNFDDPGVYHLYYGNKEGSPGTIMTFFIYPGIAGGRKGKGQATLTSFSISAGSLDYWMKRLDKFNISHTKTKKLFEGESFIYFEDYDGLGIELVANAKDMREGYGEGPVPPGHSIKGFHGVTLREENPDITARLLTGLMDHKLVAEKSGRLRFSPDGKPGSIVDITSHSDGQWGLGGNGTVHHVAFATPSDGSQMEVRNRLFGNGLNVTPVIDRKYFHSIYFREPGGVLFEVATEPPGMAVDEDPEHLGETLQLPPWEEHNRKDIEKRLAPILINENIFTD